MYGMTNSRNLFADKLTNWLIDEAAFDQSKYQNVYILQVCTIWFQLSCIILC